MRYVVSTPPRSLLLALSHPPSHASIDPAVRAARGLPEDLIRLCVGIEDPSDLLDDLERALLEAGAVTLSADHRYVRASLPQVISRAVEKLAITGDAITRREEREDREWFVSAPGKVILFGEHAVVHGVVRLKPFHPMISHVLCYRQPSQPLLTCVVSASRLPDTMERSPSTSLTSTTLAMSGI